MQEISRLRNRIILLGGSPSENHGGGDKEGHDGVKKTDEAGNTSLEGQNHGDAGGGNAQGNRSPFSSVSTLAPPSASAAALDEVSTQHMSMLQLRHSVRWLRKRERRYRRLAEQLRGQLESTVPYLHKILGIKWVFLALLLVTVCCS